MVCWLTPLLVRTAETTRAGTGCHAWPQIRRELEPIKVATFAGPTSTFRQRTELTRPQRDLLAALDPAPPPRTYQLTPTKA